MSTDDKVGGKAKELAGKATGDDDLERDGRAQHAKGKVSEAIEDAKDAASDAKEAAEGAADAARGAWDAAKDAAKDR